MTVYIILIIATLTLGYVFGANSTLKSRKIYLYITFMTLIVVSAMRKYTVGADTYQYFRAYQAIGILDWHNNDLLRYELGFFVLCKILNTISTDPQLLIVISSIVILSSVGVFIYKNSDDVVLSTYLFLTLNFYFLYMSAMRQAIAISLILFGFDFLKKKKYMIYAVFVLLASLFHQSALIAIIFILFVGRRYTIIYFMVILWMSGFAFLMADSVFDVATIILARYAHYQESTFYVSNYFASLFNAIVSLVILCFGLLYNNSLGKIAPYGKHLISNNIKVSFLNDKYCEADYLAFMMSLWFFSSVLVIQLSIYNRIAMYFGYYSIIWLSKAINSVNNVKERHVMIYFIVALTFLYCIIIMIYRPEWYSVIPYIPIWN